MTTLEEHLSNTQREALWKWRWLGWKGSTPAFKASMVLLALAAIGIAAAPLFLR